MAAITGVNTTFVTAVSWMLGIALAGAAGVLLGPIQGFDLFHFTLLMLVSFAAVVVARMHSLVLGFAGAMLIGLAQQLAKSQQADNLFGHVLGKDSVLFHGLEPSIPFIIMLVFLLAYSGLSKEAFALDDRRMVQERRETRGPRPWWRRLLPLAVLLTGVLVAPAFLSGLWEAIFAKGLAISIIMLSITVVTGEGGMISLCQATFAGVAGAITAQLATNHGMPVIYAIVLSALIVVPIGLLAALPSLRLGDLYLALATLTFAQLVQNTYFQVQSVNNDDQGVAVPRPVGFTKDLPFYYLLVGCFIVVAVVVRNLKRSTTGLELVAMRSSEPATATLGVSIMRSKLVAFGVSAFIAGLGGALYATYSRRIVPAPQFNALIGIVWFAVLVTWGMRSIAGALIAGLSFAVLPELFSEHLHGGWLQVPTILFGLGAIGLAREPRGVMYQIVFGHRNRLARRKAKRAAAPDAVPGPAVVS
jgi:branched-chain amino acid transport system permease protein